MLFKRKRKCTINANEKVADVYVTTATIVSSHDDGSGLGPKCVTMYFLAKCEAGEYYELFSGKRLEKEEKSENCRYFNIPYVEKAEPLSKYLKNPNQATINIHSLFDFITNMNVLSSLGAFSDKSTE